MAMTPAAVTTVMVLTETLRQALPSTRIVYNCGGGSFKSQLRKADKSGALLALLIGDDELAQQQVSIKWLRGQQQEQQSVDMAQAIPTLQSAFKRGDEL